MSDLVDDERWLRRATRARRLAGERAAVSETLYFYADLAEVQASLVQRYRHLICTASTSFADRLDPGAALKALPEVIAFVQREAPADLSQQLGLLGDDEVDRWLHRIHTYWITGGREAWDANAIQRFVLEALLQPFAEGAARVPRVPEVPKVPKGPEVPKVPGVPGVRCEVCSGLPVAAMLREQGHGSKRSLVCGFCLSEWPSPRLACVNCGESAFESLPVFRGHEFAIVRIDACDSCHSYVKTIDLTQDGEASPIVDDIASLSLDLWAREQGYGRVRPNLFGF